jgi:ribosomal-protein-alanine N-acetyltransferase
MTPARMAAIHAAAFEGKGEVWSEAEIAALRAQPTTDFVATGNNGFVLLRIIPPEAEILTLAVDPAAQRRGLGVILVDVAAALVAGRGAETLFLEVAEDNTAARALYDKAGFTEVGRRKGYYARHDGPAVDALILSRLLPAEKTGKACKS